MPHFKAAGHTKYALEALRLLMQVNITLSPNLAHQVMWHRCNTYAFFYGGGRTKADGEGELPPFKHEQVNGADTKANSPGGGLMSLD